MERLFKIKNVHAAVAALSVVMVGAMMGPGSDVAQATTVIPKAFSGRATVVDATVLGIRTVISDTGPLPSTGGNIVRSLLTVNVPGLITASLARANTRSLIDRSQSFASVATTTLTVAGNTISADVLSSKAVAKCTVTGPVLTGSSTITRLVINGSAIVVSGAPNQTISVGPLTVVINQQDSTQTVKMGAINVTALRVTVDGEVIPGVITDDIADVAISRVHADIKCPAPTR